MPVSNTFSQLSERVANLTKDVKELSDRTDFVQKTMIGLFVTIVAACIVGFITVLIGLGRL